MSTGDLNPVSLRQVARHVLNVAVSRQMLALVLGLKDVLHAEAAQAVGLDRVAVIK